MLETRKPMRQIVNKAWVAGKAKWLFGCLLMAAGYIIFIVPAYIVPGGIIGLAAIIRRLTGTVIPLGTMTWIINIALYLSTMHLLGYKHILKVFAASTALAIFIDAFTPLVNHYVIPVLYSSGTAAISPNLLLYAVIGGGLNGIGVAIVYRSGGATGGSDCLAYALQRLMPKLTLAQYMLLVDGIIIFVTVLVVNNWNLALYAAAVKFVTYKVVDSMLSGINYAKEVQIISKCHERISERILQEMNRGVTAYQCKGMYTGEDKVMLLCIIKTEQIAELKAIVQQEDPLAFVVLSNTNEVMGRGFTLPLEMGERKKVARDA
jgi:uncharacterized membrane-anchored protein YitT (DUF2179 family)